MSSRRFLGFVLCFLFLESSRGGATAPSSSAKGLYVSQGTLMRGGRPYAGIGANYDTLFGRLLQNKDDNSSLENLALLADKGIPFVRFRACGFSPKNCQLYLDDPAEYFRRMDKVVRCAEQHHIGLIPSLFWRLATFAELVGDPPSRLGDPNSKVSEFIKGYTQEMVSRYKDSPAIWGWEFGNEANNGVDMHRSRKGPGLFGSEEAGVRLTSRQLVTAYATFARAVRRIDPTRTIDTGTTVPRPAAWHNAHGEAREHDSPAQSYAMLLLESPDPANMLSIHVYQKTQKLSPYGPESVSRFLGRYAQFAAKAGKPLFLGEFPVRDPPQAREYLRAIEENHVPLSTFWTFDNSKQEATMNVTLHNERSFVFDLVAKANQVLQKSH